MRDERPPAAGPDAFVAWLGPIASSAQERTGIPASVVIAQGALESAWGASQLAQRATNLFGVKAGSSWRGRVISSSTREVVNGEWITVPGSWRVYPTVEYALADGQVRSSLFRVYDSTRAALLDQARVFYNGLYEPALAYRRDPEMFARLIGPTYATDPAYSQKVISIMHARRLTSWDVPPHRWRLDPSIVPERHRATWAASIDAGGDA